MKRTLEQKLIMISILGLVHWLCGNIYEAIVFSPNWVIDSPEQIRRLNEFFIITSPTTYFVPITQCATMLVWVIAWKNKEVPVGRNLKLASIFALLATIVNVFVVTTTAIKLFSPDYAKYGTYLTTLTWRWNVLNIFRMALTGATVYFLFDAYRILDRRNQKHSAPGYKIHSLADDEVQIN